MISILTGRHLLRRNLLGHIVGLVVVDSAAHIFKRLFKQRFQSFLKIIIHTGRIHIIIKPEILGIVAVKDSSSASSLSSLLKYQYYFLLSISYAF